MKRTKINLCTAVAGTTWVTCAYVKGHMCECEVPQDNKDPDHEDRYRRFAQSCLKLAHSASDQATRAMFLSMAQAWNSLADRNLAEATEAALEDFNQRQLDG